MDAPSLGETPSPTVEPDSTADDLKLKVEGNQPTATREDQLAANVSIKLAFPITVGGSLLTTITMRRAKVRDRLNMARTGANSEVAFEALLIGNLCNIAPDEIEEMDLLDYRKLQNQLETFSNPLLSVT